jgi:hypothetical protein
MTKMKNLISEIADPSMQLIYLLSPPTPGVFQTQELGHKWLKESVFHISKVMKMAITAILKKDGKKYYSTIDPLDDIMDKVVELYTYWYKELYKPSAIENNKKYYNFVNTLSQISKMFLRITQDITDQDFPTGPNFIGAKKDIENLNALFTSLTSHIDEMFGSVMYAPKHDPNIRTV